MTEQQRAAAFPIHIDLGRKADGMNMPMAVEGGEGKGKKGRPKKYYPSVYIDGIEGLEKIPKDCCALVHLRRKRLSLEEDSDGEETAGVTLELRRICLAEDDENTVEDELARAFGDGPKESGETETEDESEEYEDESEDED